jgi:hypothetical protein
MNQSPINIFVLSKVVPHFEVIFSGHVIFKFGIGLMLLSEVIDISGGGLMLESLIDLKLLIFDLVEHGIIGLLLSDRLIWFKKHVFLNF